MQSYQSAYWTENYTAGYGNTLQFYYNSTVGRIEVEGIGSFISTVSVPDGTNSYSAKATVLGTSNTYIAFDLYLRASSDADYYKSTGTYYLVHYAKSSTVYAVYVYKRVSGVLTMLAGTNVPLLNDGDTISAMVNDNGDIAAYVNNAAILHANDTSISSGQPGVGISNYYNLNSSGTTAGTAITNVQLGPAYRTPPGPVTTPTVSAYATHIDFQWPAVSDGNGAGIAYYSWYRNYQWVANTTSLTWSDTTVQPGNEYIYTFQVTDMQWNVVTPDPITVSAAVAPAGSPNPPDGREIGVRPTGTYWGGNGEQIDVLSGNVNYTVPLLTAKGRTGWNAPFNLTYNSQNWRQDSGGLWNLGADVGYGYGWNLMAGSILPVYSGPTLIYYLFTDATGAQYRLSINNGGIWSSPESVYLEYDSNVSPGRLYFRNGQFWVMGCTSAAGEPDQGTMYPTILEDTNGNQLQVQYMSNASARITYITDFRAVYPTSYNFTYSSGHLSAIYSQIGTAESYTFSYGTQTLQSPFSPYTSYGTTTVLATVTTYGPGTQQSFTYTSDNSAALSYAYLRYGGYLHWTYNNVSYTGGATYQQVQNRYLSKDGVSSTLYPFSHESSTANLHQYTIIDDPGGVGEKYWAFSLSGANTGVVTQYQGRQLPGPVTKTQNDLTWAQDSTGDLYIQSSITTLDPGQSYQVQKRTDQNVDVHGNITQVYQYAYNSLTSPARIYTYQYLAPNTTYHIYDRLTQVSVSWGLGTTWTIVTNAYTNYTNATPSTAPPLWDSTYAASSPRSNLSTSTVPGSNRQYIYNLLGVATTSQVNGVSTTITPSSTNGYAVPSQLTTGSVSETLNWTSFLGLTSATGQNGDQGLMTYDSWGRPSNSTSPFGANTFYTYATAPYTSAHPSWTTSTVNLNGRWTKTTVDGLGRTVKVEKGDASGTKSQVDTVYDSCGCSPLGKLKQTSLPHAPAAGAVWTTNTYDGIGRTLSVQLPDGASTTTYTYQGNLVTVTDPAGNWKKYTMDAFGRLAQVEEPNPSGGSYFTTYTYDLLDHLIGVSMPRSTGTQTRTFNYTNPTTGQPGALLLSATNPESGTVSYTYDSNNRPLTIVDAKGQQKRFFRDSMGRITQVHRSVTSGGLFVEDPMQLTTYYYDTNPFNSTYSQNALGRLAAVQYYGGNCSSYTPSGSQSGCDLIQEWYSYSTAGARVGKKVVLTRGSASGSLSASWTYDNEGRALSGTYPSWKACSSCSTVNGSSYTYAYDTMGRLNTMTDTVNTRTLVSGMTYGVANEVQQMTSGYTTGVNSETHTFNGMFQLTQLQVGSSALNIQYFYSATQNNGKITSQTDVLSGEQIAYTYDALNRLASAQTTQTGGTQWGQSYTYDGFGNLTDQTVIKGSAPDVHVAYNYSTNRQTGDTADYNGNIGSGYIYDLENRLVQPGSSATAHYGYDTGNKRVWRGDTGVDEIAFWNGQRLATYQISTSGSVVYFALTSTRAYFGSKLISQGTYNSSGTGDKVNLAPVVADRLGSIGKFYPYGVERPSATGNDKEKFTGYFRDASTGLDYADQRYHQPGVGRFMSPDPFDGSAKATQPGSWNRYAYVGGDPVNGTDPSGLYISASDDTTIFDCDDRGCGSGDGFSGDWCNVFFFWICGGPMVNNPGTITDSWIPDTSAVDDPGTSPIASIDSCAYTHPCDALSDNAQQVGTGISTTFFARDSQSYESTNVSIPIPVLGNIVSVGVTVSTQSNGNVFLAPGVSFGWSGLPLSISVMDGATQPGTDPAQLLSGWGYNAGGGTILGFGINTNSAGTAIETGVTTPQATIFGLSYGTCISMLCQ
jgi:RHS repeat-associated protein